MLVHSIKESPETYYAKLHGRWEISDKFDHCLLHYFYLVVLFHTVWSVQYEDVFSVELFLNDYISKAFKNLRSILIVKLRKEWYVCWVWPFSIPRNVSHEDLRLMYFFILIEKNIIYVNGVREVNLSCVYWELEAVISNFFVRWGFNEGNLAWRVDWNIYLPSEILIWGSTVALCDVQLPELILYDT